MALVKVTMFDEGSRKMVVSIVGCLAIVGISFAPLPPDLIEKGQQIIGFVCGGFMGANLLEWIAKRPKTLAGPTAEGGKT